MSDMIGIGLGLVTGLFLGKKKEIEEHNKREQRRAMLPDLPCDMCDGTGLVMRHETPVYATTAAGDYNSYDQNMNILSQEEVDAIPVVAEPCGTCKGTGILPNYLQPDYWK